MKTFAGDSLVNPQRLTIFNKLDNVWCLTSVQIDSAETSIMGPLYRNLGRPCPIIICILLLEISNVHCCLLEPENTGKVIYTLIIHLWVQFCRLFHNT